MTCTLMEIVSICPYRNFLQATTIDAFRKSSIFKFILPYYFLNKNKKPTTIAIVDKVIAGFVLSVFSRRPECTMVLSQKSGLLKFQDAKMFLLVKCAGIYFYKNKSYAISLRSIPEITSRN